MGQKVNPNSQRIGITRTWDSLWFAGAGKNMASQIAEDAEIRKYLFKTLASAGINKVIIERAAGKLVIGIHASRPGVVIGKRGADIEKAKAYLSKLTNSNVSLNIIEVRKPDVESTLVAQSIAQQLEKRVSFRRAMKRAVQNALKAGAKGIKIACAGRLGGTEIARTEWYREGRVPLHTLRADISYGTAQAHTTYGIIGVKVWIFRGEIETKIADSTEVKSVQV